MSYKATFDIGGELKVNRLGFGGAQLPGPGVWEPPRDREEALAVLRRAVELGVTFIDTADAYGPTVSEELIAEALAPYSGLVISTKAGLARTGPESGAVGWHAVGRPECLRQQLEMSLRRLGRDHMDLFHLHRIDPKVPREEQFGMLRDAKDAGKIRHVGLSEVSIEEIGAARRIVDIASVQNRYNLGDQRADDVIDYCEEHRIGFVPWFPLSAGKLAESGGPVDAIAARHGVMPGAVALAWLLHRSDVILPIPGTSSGAHLEQNMAAASLVLEAEDLAELAAVVPA
jgi:aryl-alcohol dehydrogenase-like predicted oxidoreductase